MIRRSPVRIPERKMTAESFIKHLVPGKPATYRIVVEGSLSSDWEERLGGMRVVPLEACKDGACTALAGRVRDQAELIGVINSLHGFHVPILRVEIINDDSNDSPELKPNHKHIK